MSSAPDLLGAFDRALEHTRKEITTLDDLTERVQHVAGRVLSAAKHQTPASPQTLDELEKALDKLAEWQMSNVHQDGVARRAQARRAVDELRVRMAESQHAPQLTGQMFDGAELTEA